MMREISFDESSQMTVAIPTFMDAQKTVSQGVLSPIARFVCDFYRGDDRAVVWEQFQQLIVHTISDYLDALLSYNSDTGLLEEPYGMVCIGSGMTWANIPTTHSARQAVNCGNATPADLFIHFYESQYDGLRFRDQLIGVINDVVNQCNQALVLMHKNKF